jgi:hypothetical protein
VTDCNTNDPRGFSGEKGAPDYWLDAVREFWAETGLDTDSIELAVIVNWFDQKREQLAHFPCVVCGKPCEPGNDLCPKCLANSF